MFFLLKYIPASESVLPGMTRLLPLLLKGEAVGKIKPDGTVETKLSDKSELMVNYKITF